MVTNAHTSKLAKQVNREKRLARYVSEQRDHAMSALQIEQQAHTCLRAAALDVAAQAMRDDETGCYAVPIELLDRMMWVLEGKQE